MEYATTLLKHTLVREFQGGLNIVPWVSDIVFPHPESDLEDRAAACKSKQSPAGHLGITQVCEALQWSATATKKSRCGCIPFFD